MACDSKLSDNQNVASIHNHQSSPLEQGLSLNHSQEHKDGQASLVEYASYEDFEQQISSEQKALNAEFEAIELEAQTLRRQSQCWSIAQYIAKQFSYNLQRLGSALYIARTSLKVFTRVSLGKSYSSCSELIQHKTHVGIKMVKETSDAAKAATENKSSSASSAVSTVVDSASFASQAQLKELEYRLSTQVAAKSGGKTGLLWVVTLLTIAAAGFGGFTAYQNQQRINLMTNEYSMAQNKVNDALAKIDRSATLLETAQMQNSALVQNNATLTQNYNNMVESVNGVVASQEQMSSDFATLSSKVANFEARNPLDWQLAEAYFLVNNAQSKAVFEKDLKAALWMLTQADELIANIEEEQVVALRAAISKDMATLKNITAVDVRGLGLSLDRAYDNVDNLVLEGYSDPKTRQAAFEKHEGTTENLADWKENLLNSANEFASRFVEVRRRNAEAATEFLTPAQDLYLRENIKTRILLAKSDLSHGDKESMQSNLQDAINLVNAYFDPESLVTKNVLETLNSLVNSEITIKTPDVLQSATAFSNFAHQHLLGRGK